MELDRLVGGSVSAQVADELERQVLALAPPRQRPLELYSDALRHFQPGVSCGEGQHDVSGPHSGAVVSDGPIECRMRIRPQDNVTRPGKPLLDQHLVADAPSRVEKLLDP